MSQLLMRIWIGLLVVLVAAVSWIVFNNLQRSTELDSASGNLSSLEAQAKFGSIFDTDFSKVSIDLDLLLSGGVGKDGIPALDNPEFEPIAQSTITKDTLGIYIEVNGEQKFYPYNILVWHEIINDEIGGQKVAITFCPLCGSAVAYNPVVDGEVLEFGVSGLLYESNLVMYDRRSESFWRQALGEAVVGEYLGTKLEILPFQLLTLEKTLEKHPDTLIMTTNTGFSRNYDRTPYGNYNENEEIYFPVTNRDARYPAKEIFYIIRQDEGTVAIRKDGFAFNQKFVNEELGLTFTNNDGEITVTNEEGELIAGYYEMWFSWVNQNPDNPAVWDGNI